MYHIYTQFNFMSGGYLDGNAGKDPRTYHIHNTSCFNFMSGGSLEGHAGEDPRMYRIHSTTLCPEDPLRDMLGRIPGCTTYLGSCILCIFVFGGCRGIIEGGASDTM